MTSLPSIVESEFITGNELFQMGDIGPCELVEGRIVPMSPTSGLHGFIESQLVFYLQEFVLPKKLGWVLTGEAGIFTQRNPDTVRGADVLFISKKRLPKIPQRGFLEVAPELVIEILSPTGIRKEIEQKIDEYFTLGVKWVWVVEPKNRTCLIYHSKNKIQRLSESDSIIGEEILAGLEIKVTQLFSE